MSKASSLEGKEEVRKTSGDICPNRKSFSFNYAKSLWSRRLVCESANLFGQLQDF